MRFYAGIKFLFLLRKFELNLENYESLSIIDFLNCVYGNPEDDFHPKQDNILISVAFQPIFHRLSL
jgi:hypothetical protein